MSFRGPSFRALLENQMFLSGCLSWFLAQLAKAIIVLFQRDRQREFFGIIFWRTGGMPSSHSALFSAVAASAAYTEGIGSNLFVLSFFIAVTMMRDALGVRRSTGLQARTLNILGKDLSRLSSHEFKPVKEVHGHTPLEVITGAILGIIIATAVASL